MIIILNNDSCCNFETEMFADYSLREKKNKIYVKNRNSITYTKIHNYRKYFFSVSIES